VGRTLTGRTTTAAIARILGRRVDELTAAIRDALAVLEADDQPLPPETRQQLAARLREVL
jgi:hypothetical protein